MCICVYTLIYYHSVSRGVPLGDVLDASETQSGVPFGAGLATRQFHLECPSQVELSRVISQALKEPLSIYLGTQGAPDTAPVTLWGSLWTLWCPLRAL